jgi:long-subunit acyl-CoA synthetase (AMP-forming)
MAAPVFRFRRQIALLPLLSSAHDERSQHVMGDLKTLNPLALFGCARVFEKLNHALRWPVAQYRTL